MANMTAAENRKTGLFDWGISFSVKSRGFHRASRILFLCDKNMLDLTSS